MEKTTPLPTKIATALLRAYQLLISPVLGTHCRFSPTCSHYAITAINKHGVMKGGLLSLKRLGCCHPWHIGGHDPVP